MQHMLHCSLSWTSSLRILTKTPALPQQIYKPARAVCQRQLSFLLSKQVLWTEAAFSAYVWHGIDQTILDNPIDEWRGRLRTHGHICGHFQQLLWQFGHRRFSFVLNVTRFWILECIFGNYHIFGLLNFRKLGWQHTQGMVGSIILVFLEINFSFQQWKNFENLLRIIDKVIAISLVYYFFATQCIKFVNVLSK